MKSTNLAALGLLAIAGCGAVAVGAWPETWGSSEILRGATLAGFVAFSVATLVTRRDATWAGSVACWAALCVVRFQNPHELPWPAIALVGLGGLASAEASHLLVRSASWPTTYNKSIGSPLWPILGSLAGWSMGAAAMVVGAWFGLQAAIDASAPSVVVGSWERHGGLVLGLALGLLALGAWLVRSRWWLPSSGGIRHPNAASKPAAATLPSASGADQP